MRTMSNGGYDMPNTPKSGAEVNVSRLPRLIQLTVAVPLTASCATSPTGLKQSMLVPQTDQNYRPNAEHPVYPRANPPGRGR